MTLALGILYSLAIGTGDFFGGWASRRAPAFTVVVTFLVGGAIVSAPLLLLVPSEFVRADAGFGALSGFTVGFALVFLYVGMAASSAAVVSPVTAVTAALIPVGWSLSTGESLSRLVAAGIVVALVGLAVTTVSPELGARVKVGAAWGVAAGIAFGTGFVFLGQVSIDSGMWATVSQRIVALVFLGAITAAQGLPLVVDRALLPRSLLGGALGGIGVAAFVGGAQRGSLAEITVTASMFPAVTAVLSAIFEDHPLRWWQLLGIAGVITGVALIGIG